MKFFFRWTRLFSAATRRPSAEDSPDPADMGTAFGLDASLEEEAALAASAESRRIQDPAYPSNNRLVRRPWR